MLPDNRFVSQPRRFWATVSAISQSVGYSSRGESRVKAPTVTEFAGALIARGVPVGQFIDNRGNPTQFGQLLSDYFDHRARLLNEYVRERLMDVERAAEVFHDLQATLNPGCPIPMNKQRGEMKAPAYFTGIVNMLVEANAAGMPCDFDPKSMITVQRRGELVFTSSRRFDGAFSATANPIAVWEVKEQYYTTTFGSRVAAGVYESMLDGMEFAELRDRERVEVKHYFMLDAFDTWWVKGRSYLCRLIDMLHMGFADEVLFGYEVVERLPSIVQEWVETARNCENAVQPALT